MKPTLLEWAENCCRTRLQRQHGEQVRRISQKIEKVKAETGKTRTRLEEILRKWKHRKGGPDELEKAWIIESQIHWKGGEITEIDFWEDLPETDPKWIMELDRSGPEEDTLLPREVIQRLARVIEKLEGLGHEIRDQTYSANWQRRRSAGSSRIQEIKPRPVRQKRKVEIGKKTRKQEGWKRRRQTSLESTVTGAFQTVWEID